MKITDKIILEYMSRGMKKDKLFREKIMMIKFWINKMGAEEKNEYLRKANIVKKLNKNQNWFREKILKIIDNHGGDDVTKDCKCEVCMREMNEGIVMMKSMENISQLKIKNILTVKEYNRFLPVWEEFKYRGILKTHPHEIGGQLIRFI